MHFVIILGDFFGNVNGGGRGTFFCKRSSETSNMILSCHSDRVKRVERILRDDEGIHSTTQQSCSARYDSKRGMRG